MTNDILKTIKIENYIWIIYILIIILCFYSNYQEANYYKYNDLYAKEKYRQANIIIFSTVFLVYLYFFVNSLESISNLTESTNKEKVYFENLNFIATTLVLIAGAIFLYIAISDKNLETEIAFS